MAQLRLCALPVLGHHGAAATGTFYDDLASDRMSLPDPSFWRGRRVLITGHTGFKGGWLALWLAHFGAYVTGYALPPETGDGIYVASGGGRAIRPVTGEIKVRSLLCHC